MKLPWKNHRGMKEFSRAASLILRHDPHSKVPFVTRPDGFVQIDKFLQAWEKECGKRRLKMPIEKITPSAVLDILVCAGNRVRFDVLLGLEIAGSDPCLAM